MKKAIIISLLLVNLSLCSFLSEKTYESLKDIGLFDIFSPKESPFANYTEEQFTKMFNYGQELPKVNPFT